MNINISFDSNTLSEEELKKLVKCIRDIEKNKPIRNIKIRIDSQEKIVENIEDIVLTVRSNLPIMRVLGFKKR